jgi:hypothetical protein
MHITSDCHQYLSFAHPFFLLSFSPPFLYNHSILIEQLSTAKPGLYTSFLSMPAEKVAKRTVVAVAQVTATKGLKEAKKPVKPIAVDEDVSSKSSTACY